MNTALDPPARPSPHLPMGPARCWRPRGDGGTEGPRDGQRADSEREGGRRGRPGFKAALRGPRPGRSRRRPQPRRCGRGAGRLREGIRPRPGAARRGSEVEAVLCLLPGLSGRGFGDFVYLLRASLLLILFCRVLGWVRKAAQCRGLNALRNSKISVGGAKREIPPAGSMEPFDACCCYTTRLYAIALLASCSTHLMITWLLLGRLVSSRVTMRSTCSLHLIQTYRRLL